MLKLFPFAGPFTSDPRVGADAPPLGRWWRAAAHLAEDTADVLVRSVVFTAGVGAILAVTGAGLRLLT